MTRTKKWLVVQPWRSACEQNTTVHRHVVVLLVVVVAEAEVEVEVVVEVVGGEVGPTFTIPLTMTTTTTQTTSPLIPVVATATLAPCSQALCKSRCCSACDPGTRLKTQAVVGVVHTHEGMCTHGCFCCCCVLWATCAVVVAAVQGRIHT